MLSLWLNHQNVFTKQSLLTGYGATMSTTLSTHSSYTELSVLPGHVLGLWLWAVQLQNLLQKTDSSFFYQQGTILACCGAKVNRKRITEKYPCAVLHTAQFMFINSKEWWGVYLNERTSSLVTGEKEKVMLEHSKSKSFEHFYLASTGTCARLLY